MKPPSALNRLDNPGKLRPIKDAAYPSLGFLLLGGDGSEEFGLYWPYKLEQREPIVVMTDHNCYGLEPHATRLELLLDWEDRRAENEEREIAGDDDRDFRDVEEIDFDDEEIDDPDLPQRRFVAAMKLCGTDPAAAVAALEGICVDFPESTEIWQSLANQRRRTGDLVGAGRAAIRAFASNWAFGFPNEPVLRQLRDAARLPDLAADPLVARAASLSLKFGGDKQNAMYGVLRECIEAYLSSSEPVLGLLLNQNYGYMMTSETISFQERYGFDRSAWYAEQVRLCERHLGDGRVGMD